MAGRKRKAPRRRPQPAASTEWYVPFIDDHAVIYHGHESRDDHSQCGPHIFCCPNAARVLKTVHPKAIPADADWQQVDAEHLLSWLGPTGPKMFYFFYCDPPDTNRIRFVSVSQEDLPAVLRRELSLHAFDDAADTLTCDG